MNMSEIELGSLVLALAVIDTDVYRKDIAIYE